MMYVTEDTTRSIPTRCAPSPRPPSTRGRPLIADTGHATPAGALPLSSRSEWWRQEPVGTTGTGIAIATAWAP
jgi:hypothetical protein